jgi:hypothetical protein
MLSLPSACRASVDAMGSGFDERLREFLAQTGMMSSLSEEDLASVTAALSAIKSKMEAFPQPSIGDAPAEACRLARPAAADLR